MGNKSTGRRGALILVALAMLLSACGGNQDDVSGETQTDVNGDLGTESAEPVELVVRGIELTSAPQSFLDDLASAFSEEYPEYSVRFQLRGAFGDDVPQITEAHLANEQFDLIHAAANPARVFVERGIYKDITEDVDYLDRFVDRTIEPFSYGDRLYGIPWSYVTTSAIYYNKSMLQDLGLDEPKSYSDWLDLKGQLADEGVAPIVHQGANDYMWPMWYFETFAQTSENSSIEKTKANLRGEAKFTDAADVKALERIVQFQKDGLFIDNVTGIDWDGMRAAFATEQAFAYYGGSWELPWIVENVPDDMEVGIIRFPALEPGNEPQHGGQVDLGLAIYSGIKEEHYPAALAFLEFASRDEWLAKMVEYEITPETSNVGVPGSDHPLAAEMREKFMPHTITFLDYIWPDELKTEFQAGIQAAVAGERTPQEVMENVQATFDELVAEGYKFEFWKDS